MDTIPLSRIKQIMRVISGGQMGSLEVIRHTGMRWKNPGFADLKKLKDAGFLTQRRDKIRHKTRLINELTVLGKQVLHLIQIIDSYESDMLKFRESIRDRILFIEPDQICVLNT
jgi:polysaccharide pyruvyl transferase WcaK-like protein